MQKLASRRPRCALAEAVKRQVRRRSYDKVRRLAVIVDGASIFVDGGMTLYPGFEAGG
jgi:hypothetical protein